MDIENGLLMPLLVVVSGFLTTYIMTGLRRFSTAIDKLNPYLKQAILVVLAFGVNQLSEWLKLPLPADPTTWSAEVVNSLLTSLTSLGIYNIRKTRKPPNQN